MFNGSVYYYENKELGKLRMLHLFKAKHDGNMQRIVIAPPMQKAELEKFLRTDVICGECGFENFTNADFEHFPDTWRGPDLFLSWIKTEYGKQGKGLATDALRAIAMVAEQQQQNILRLIAFPEDSKFYKKLGFRLDKQDPKDKLLHKAVIRKSAFADFSQFKKDEELTELTKEILFSN